MSHALAQRLPVAAPPREPDLRRRWEALDRPAQRRLVAHLAPDGPPPAPDVRAMVAGLAAARHRRRRSALAWQLLVAWLWLMLLWGLGRSLGGAAEPWGLAAGVAVAVGHLIVAVPAWRRRSLRDAALAGR